MIKCKIEDPQLDITPQMARSAVNVLQDYHNKDLLELPCVINDKVIFMHNGEPAMLTCGNRQEAEDMLKDMRR